jgi:hypothetical protein
VNARTRPTRGLSLGVNATRVDRSGARGDGARVRGVLAIALATGGCVVGSIYEPPLVSITGGDHVEAPGCPSYPAGTYTPYANGSSERDTVAAVPWRGPDGGYPNGDEDFSAYGAGEMVECSSDKSTRAYLDVTDGCLEAIYTGTGTVMRGGIQATSDGYYRAVALGFAPGDPDHAVRWTDQAVSYRFHYTKQTGDVGNPGFKLFARYNTELDLYVASWRTDGVVQIQKKQCGDYTPLVIDESYGAPSPNAWHDIEFKAVGEQLSFYVDGKLAVSAADATFKSGTAGMRIDSMNDAAIETWRVSAP